jgi:hypothetical protein
MEEMSFNRLSINDQDNMQQDTPHDDSDREDDKYDDIELPTIVRNRDILSSPETYVELNCFFCLQNTRFKKDDVHKHYPIMGETQKEELNKLISDAKLAGTFKTTGSIQIADWFNSKVVDVMNSISSRFIEKYVKITAEDVYIHFSEHVQTTDTMIDQTIEQLHTLSNDIFKSCAIMKQSKTKTSNKTSNKKIKPNDAIIKTWQNLLKTKLEYIKVKLTSNASSTLINQKKIK